MTTAIRLDWSEACNLAVKDWHQGKPYWHGVECVPPADMKWTAYLCGEPFTDVCGEPVCSAAVRVDGKFYHMGMMTRKRFKNHTISDLRAAIALGEELSN